MLNLDASENIDTLPRSIVKKIKARVKYVNDGISRIEKASGITYPPYNIRPMILLSESAVELGQRGVIYARVIPEEGPAGLLISVELSAPLVAFGLKGTIQAVLAHEFMHYVELVRKFTTLDILSDETVGTLHETIYSDYERLYEPKWLFQDRGLIRLLNSRFLDGLVDDRLNKNTLKKWVQKDLPSKILPPDANVVRIPIASILRTNFDPLLKNRLEELEKIRAVANE
ncbi:MAG: hypothetical protein QF812_00135 [Nitrososphaerales archaeon]|jgi:hypothetical protein|nr:hypothetical protein [Nitrososphaerales archaeon]|tara:strand:+ start:3644 stop:4330 length:687 start_codon:yes stop_codon:yes gene_type:complete